MGAHLGCCTSPPVRFMDRIPLLRAGAGHCGLPGADSAATCGLSSRVAEARGVLGSGRVQVPGAHVLLGLLAVRAPGPLPLAGGQRVLAVDFPRSPSAEEQQGPLLSAAVETAASHAPEPGSDQGLGPPGPGERGRPRGCHKRDPSAAVLGALT